MANDFLRQMDTRALARVGAALWFAIDTTVVPDDFRWSRSVLGPDGEVLLWKALRDENAITESGRLDAQNLATCLRQWAEVINGTRPGDMVQPVGDSGPHLVWTIPEPWPATPSPDRRYIEAVIDTIRQAQEKLWLVAPYIEKSGFELVAPSLLAGLDRGLSVFVISQDLDRIDSWQSNSLEQFRDLAEFWNRGLHLYVPARDGDFVHAKIVLADHIQMVVGSANLTNRGFSDNVELGVVLGPRQCEMAERTLSLWIDSGLLKCVVSTGGGNL